MRVAPNFGKLFERKLPGNIIITAYEKPKTIEELRKKTSMGIPEAKEVGIIICKMDFGLLLERNEQ